MNQRLFVGVAALCLIAASAAFGQVTMPRSVISSGGTVASGGSVSVQGSVGQPIIGRSSSSPLEGALGFWHLLMPYSPSAVTGGAVTGALDAAIGVVPHPVVGRASIRLSVPAGSTASLRLYDALGRMRQSLLSDERTDGRPISLDADQLETGTYTLVLVIDGRQTTRTIQVAH